MKWRGTRGVVGRQFSSRVIYSVNFHGAPAVPYFFIFTRPKSRSTSLCTLRRLGYTFNSNCRCLCFKEPRESEGTRGAPVLFVGSVSIESNREAIVRCCSSPLICTLQFPSFTHTHTHTIMATSSLEPSNDQWRRYGEQRRRQLIEKDEKAGGMKFHINPECTLQRYLDLSERVSLSLRRGLSLDVIQYNLRTVVSLFLTSLFALHFNPTQLSGDCPVSHVM